MRIIIIILILTLIPQFSFSQNNRKGQLFVSWGWNRDSYSDSDITFTGNNYNFKLHNVKADDKRKVFSDGFRESSGLSLPESNQINIKLGYFISDNYNIVLGYDNMKYVLRNEVVGKISGEISSGTYSFEGAEHNFDGGYGYNDINYTRSLVIFEHDGLNYFFIGVNRFDNLNNLLGINTDNFEINLEEGVDVGLMVSKTKSKILNNEEFIGYSKSGFGFSANLGINFTFFKNFYLKPELKYGFVNLDNLRITQNLSDKASQKFNFTETSLSIGVRFDAFSSRQKTNLKRKELKNKNSNLNKIQNDTLKSNTTKRNELVFVDESPLDSIKCPDLTLKYKEKSSAAIDKNEQKKYSWLTLYYDYLCECKEGTNRPIQLVTLINNIVDSYFENTNEKREKITKVSQCRSLTKGKE